MLPKYGEYSLVVPTLLGIKDIKIFGKVVTVVLEKMYQRKAIEIKACGRNMILIFTSQGRLSLYTL